MEGRIGRGEGGEYTGQRRHLACPDVVHGRGYHRHRRAKVSQNPVSLGMLGRSEERHFLKANSRGVAGDSARGG
jgi:hypothetical protein